MEPEGSLLHLHVPATCLYPEPAQFRPYLHILHLKNNFDGLKRNIYSLQKELNFLTWHVPQNYLLMF
jgi:hypothetical protein